MRHNPQRELWYSRPVTVRTVINPSQAMRTALADRQRGKKNPWKRSDSADGTYTDIPDLAAYNGISNPDVISVGQVIRKPRSGNNNQNGGTAYMFGVRVITLGA